jgi:hypothetical protein
MVGKAREKIGGRGGQKFEFESKHLFEKQYKMINNRKRGAH